jgi:hypothetical protein
VSNPARIGLVLVAVVVAVVLFFVLREGDDDGEPQQAGATAIQDTTTEETDTSAGGDETTTAAETTEPTTTQEAPDVVRALITIGPEGPSGVQRIDARQDQRVIIAVRSQLTDHVHLHGYDLLADVAPGMPARIQFRATIPGRFEIELEDRGVEIAQLRVTP